MNFKTEPMASFTHKLLPLNLRKDGLLVDFWSGGSNTQTQVTGDQRRILSSSAREPYYLILLAYSELFKASINTKQIQERVQ